MTLSWLIGKVDKYTNTIQFYKSKYRQVRVGQAQGEGLGSEQSASVGVGGLEHSTNPIVSVSNRAVFQKEGWSPQCSCKLQNLTFFFKDTVKVAFIRVHQDISYMTTLQMLWRVRVAGLGRLPAGAKMGMKIFVQRVFTISATNVSFLCVIANLQIQLNKICNIYHSIVHFLPKKHCF